MGLSLRDRGGLDREDSDFLSLANTMAAMEQLHDGDDAARCLVMKGCVGEGAAQSYLAGPASIDLCDPDVVLADRPLSAGRANAPTSCLRSPGPPSPNQLLIGAAVPRRAGGPFGELMTRRNWAA